MSKVTIIRYGELALKSGYVRTGMEHRLIGNIYTSMKLAGLSYKVRRDFGRIYILGYSQKLRKILQKTFGIVSFSPAESIDTDFVKVKKAAIKMAREFRGSFAADVRRVGAHDFSSKDMEIAIADAVVDKYNLTVNLTKPDCFIAADVRGGKTYIYKEVIRGPGGMPLGSQGRAVAVVERDEDFIAAWLFMRRGCSITFVYRGLGKRQTGKYKKILGNWNCRTAEHFIVNNLSETKGIARQIKTEALVKGSALPHLPKKKAGIVYYPLVGFGKKEIRDLKKIIGL